MNELLIDRLRTARTKTGLKQSEVADQLGIKANTISNWEKGRTEPDIDTFVKLCDIYKIDCAALLSEVYTFERIGLDISLEEYERIKKYRSLDPYDQETVNYILDRESTRVTALLKKDDRIMELESQPAAIINFQQHGDQTTRIAEYFHSASAGGSVFILGNKATSKIIVSESDWDDRVDYIISVSGHSMEPDFSDGDKVMVSQRTEMRHGDVGIFVINGKAYIKEYGEKELISRNPHSENIKISEHDNIVCIGKVIGKLTGKYEIIDD